MRHGPWIQPDDRTGGGESTTFPRLTRVTPTTSETYYPFWPISPFVPGSPWISSHAEDDSTNAYMMAVELPSDEEIGPWFPSDYPTGVIGYEAESDHSVLLGLNASFVLATNGTDGGDTLVSATGTLRHLHSGNYTLALRGGFLPYFPYPVGGAFAGADSAEVGAWAEILHTTTGYYDTSVGPFDEWSGFIDAASADVGPDGVRRIVFGLLVDEYASGAYTSMSSGQGRNMLLQRGNIYYTWRPPRYRALYDVIPPLRQFPRGDNLVGTGGSRQRGAGSRQASNRQGWNGTYY